MAGLPGGTQQKKEKPSLSPRRRSEDEKVRASYKEHWLMGVLRRQFHVQEKSCVRIFGETAVHPVRPAPLVAPHEHSVVFIRFKLHRSLKQFFLFRAIVTLHAYIHTYTEKAILSNKHRTVFDPTPIFKSFISHGTALLSVIFGVSDSTGGRLAVVIF